MIPLDLDNDIFDTGVPILYVMSDARGDTGIAVVRAAAAQFDGLEIEVIRVPNVKNVDQLREYFDATNDGKRPRAVFHTFADAALRREIRRELDARKIPSIDLLGPSVTILSTLTGEEPSRAIGATFNGPIEK